MNTTEKINRLVQQKAQIDARLANARAQFSKQSRRDEARRKIIAGAWAFDFLGRDWCRVGEHLRGAGMLDARDAALFGLDSIRSAREQPDANPLIPPKSGAST